ncbi:outer membrane beta-barrel protein [Aquimarina longa]|uniref:outer membrane beta-barrel protein n=1 Tax=Aquimarina longa TaxID=1080221 RepID=UPI0007832779|nr:outer membrane beta-barrel protein [Aquimarina longa]
MTKQLFTTLILISLNSFSQIKFEKGYFIDNTGVKTECLIKNKDWKYNPTEFQYKLSTDATVETHTINTVVEFAIANEIKYGKFNVDIDQSNKSLNGLSRDKEPKFVKKIVFLKYVVEGKATLFLYEADNQRKYFYATKEGDVTPLVYKKYKINDTQIAKNRKYRQQLWSDVRHDGIKMSYVEKLQYNRKDLVKYFNLYNKTTNDHIDYTKREDKKPLNFSIRPGIEFQSFSIENKFTKVKTEFDNKASLRLGLEAEFVLPFNNDKWSIFIEPTYHSYTAEKKDIVYLQIQSLGVTQTTTAKVKYQALQTPIGIRYGFYITNNSKIFINGAYSFNLDFSSKIESSDEASLDIKATDSNNFIFGLGYKYKNKYSLEVRYPTKRKMFGNKLWDSSYSSPSFILGYTIL